MAMANVIAPPERYGSVAITAATGCTISENYTTIQGNLAVVELVVTANTALTGNTPVVATFDDYVADTGKLLSVVGISNTYAYTQNGANTIRVKGTVASGTSLIIWGVVTLA